MENIAKPKLVFFQFKHGQNLPDFTLLHRQQHIKCLSEFFEVILIHDDCDYQQICDKYQPELTLFENAGNILDCHRPKIKNTHTHPQIPKLGLLNADAWCNSRPVFLSDMEHWGVETFFSISVTAAEHTPEIAENLFVWPNFIDAEIYRDYNESKIVPVLFTGANYALYPWRQKIIQHISQYYPSLICPHLGYSGKRLTKRMIYGEQYARTINASWFVPTCGTVAKEVVRKHFEIPASRACLITEHSPVLEAAGFVDMHNCVFADKNNVLDKLDYLFQNQDELESIINAGYQLVHSRHTLKQREQIFQWFNLNKNLKSHQTVIQTGPFEPLIVVEKSSGLINSHIKCNGLNLMLIQQGDKELALHQYDRAEDLYLRCLYHVGIMHEPKLRLAICSLYKGNAEKSLEWIVPLIKCILEIYKAFDPDPVEWAYFVISLLCQGKLDEAIKRAEQFPSLSHPELNRTRWIISILKNKEYTLPPTNQSKYRASIHQLPNRNLDDWINNLYIMLKASQQLDLVETLIKFISLADQGLKPQESNFRAARKLVSKYSAAIQNSLFNKSSSFLGIQHSIDPIHILLRQRLKRQCGNFLRRLESRFGYFLPYNLSLKRNDEFFHAIQYITQSEDIKTALILGASSQAGSTEAFLTGIQQNLNKPTVFCINIPLPQFIKLQKHYANHSVVKCYEVSSASLENLSQQVENVIEKIKQENKIDFFDVVLLDGSELNVRTDLSNELHKGRIVMLDDVNINQKIYYDLLTDNTCILDAENSGLRNGYAIFKKSNYLVLI
jgi:hypothetical protein